MKTFLGVCLPDGDSHFQDMIARSPRIWKRPTYQFDKFLQCLPHIRRFGHAVDVGAHVGLMSMHLSRCFRQVTAFEPVPAHVECFTHNVTDGNVVLNQVALSSAPGRVWMETNKANSGLARVVLGSEVGHVKVECATLDSYSWMSPIDFLKIDVEYHERLVLRGGEQTIRRDRPCVLVENRSEDAVELLESWGARRRHKMGDDFCLSWD